MVPLGGRLRDLDCSGLDVDELLVCVLQVVVDVFERLLVVAFEEACERNQIQVSRVFYGS